MPQGKVTLNIQDGGLGIIPPSTEGLEVVMGVCSLGTPNTLYLVGDQGVLTSTLGTGPAVEAAAYQLAVAGSPVGVVPVTASVAGVAGSVTPTRVASSTGTVTVSGTPLDAYSVKVAIVSSGTGQLVTGGAVAITYSLDGGVSNSLVIAVPTSGTYVVPGTGLTLHLSVSSTTFDKGDVFTFDCTAPYYSLTDLANAFAGLFANPQTWGLVHVVGYPTAGSSAQNASDGAAMTVAVETQMVTAATNNRFARAIVEAPLSVDSDLESAYASVAAPHVYNPAGSLVLTSPLTGRQNHRHAAWALAARLAEISPAQSPGAVEDGALTGVVSLDRDETKTPGLFDARFAVCSTTIGLAGFYADIGNTMAAAGSDFSLIMNGRVMDVACTTTYTKLLQYKNKAVQVDKKTGHIKESEALAIESVLTEALTDALLRTSPPRASSVRVQVNRTDNILSTKKLRVKTRVVPLGYFESIDEDIGFDNPSLILV